MSTCVRAPTNADLDSFNDGHFLLVLSRAQVFPSPLRTPPLYITNCLSSFLLLASPAVCLCIPHVILRQALFHEPLSPTPSLLDFVPAFYVQALFH